MKTNNIYSYLFLTLILIFNVSHTFSHTIHIKYFNNVQFLLTHYSAIVATIILILLLNHITKKNLTNQHIYILLLLYLLDTYIIIVEGPHIYNIIIFLILLLLIMCFNYTYLSQTLKQNINYIIFFSGIALFFQIFEILNCEYILKNYNYFPFHIITELSAFIPICLLCKTFYKI